MNAFDFFAGCNLDTVRVPAGIAAEQQAVVDAVRGPALLQVALDMARDARAGRSRVLTVGAATTVRLASNATGIFPIYVHLRVARMPINALVEPLLYVGGDEQGVMNFQGAADMLTERASSYTLLYPRQELFGRLQAGVGLTCSVAIVEASLEEAIHQIRSMGKR